MDRQELLAILANLQAPDDEIDVRIWLIVGGDLGTPQSDQRGILLQADRHVRHFIPSATWNGRNLQAALEWCLTHNRDEIKRIAHDWGVPRFTASLDAAHMLIPKDRYLSEAREANGGEPASAKLCLRTARERPLDQDEQSKESQAQLLPCAICIAALS